ncbi:MAG TPA: hypothetical protein VGA13_10895 [Acidimicrobiales bacterium]
MSATRRRRSAAGTTAATSSADERGFFLVMFALLLVVLMISIGFVLEFGAVRKGRQESKSASDFATAAGLRALEFTSGVPAPWHGICGALDYLESNSSKFEGMTATFTTGSGAALGFDPCTTADPDELLIKNQACTANKDTWGVLSGVSPDGNVAVEIRSGYELPDPAFSEDSGLLGGGDTGDNPCEQLAVIVRESTERGFSAVIGNEELRSTIRTVGRVTTEVDASAVAALLLLERNGCEVFQTSGQGEVIIQAASGTNPGITHADSAGNETGTSRPCNPNLSQKAAAYVVYATAVPCPCPPGGGPSLVNEAAPGPDGILGTADDIPGILSMYAETVGSTHTASELGPGITPPTVTKGAIASRIHVDDKYNPSSAPAIANLHSTAHTATTGVLPAGYTEINVCTDPVDPALLTASRIYVNCDTFTPGPATVWPEATDVIFTGKINIPNNKALWMPSAERVYVRGCVSSCTGAGDFSIKVDGNSGQLRINASAVGTPTDLLPCDGRSPLGESGSVLATLNGPVDIKGGQISLCQTMLYIGENNGTGSYARRSDTTAGPNCSVALPCPYGTNSGQSANGANIAITGGSGNADWSAPNVFGADPDFAVSPFEDLALWTEGSETSAIKGVGSSRTEGVFFAPNAPVDFNGQANVGQPLNAQFISRFLNMSGLGALNLKPNPHDSVAIPFFASFELVR